MAWAVVPEVWENKINVSQLLENAHALYAVSCSVHCMECNGHGYEMLTIHASPSSKSDVVTCLI